MLAHTQSGCSQLVLVLRAHDASFRHRQNLAKHAEKVKVLLALSFRENRSKVQDDPFIFFKNGWENTEEPYISCLFAHVLVAS